MPGKKLKTVKELTEEKSIKSSKKLTGKDGKLKRRLLKFNRVELYVLEKTWYALKEIKEQEGFDWERTLGFMLDCGAITYQAMMTEIKKTLEYIKKDALEKEKKVEKKNASDTNNRESL